MGCVIVRGDDNGVISSSSSSSPPPPTTTTSPIATTTTQTNKPKGITNHQFHSKILQLSTNKSLFSSNNSEIHAEQSCISLCAACSIPTKNSTIYISMPPCKTCYGLIIESGIKKIVTRNKFTDQMFQHCAESGVDVVVIEDDEVITSRRLSFAQENGFSAVSGSKELAEERRKRKAEIAEMKENSKRKKVELAKELEVKKKAKGIKLEKEREKREEELRVLKFREKEKVSGDVIPNK